MRLFEAPAASRRELRDLRKSRFSIRSLDPARQTAGITLAMGFQQPALKKFLTIYQHRHRAVVYRFDLHMRLELAGGYPYRFPKSFHELLVNPTGRFRRFGLVERRPSALAAVALERELGYEQYLAACLEYVEVHLAFGVFEYTKAQELGDGVLDVRSGVSLLNARIDKKALVYFAFYRPVYGNGSLLYPLDDDSHLPYRTHFYFFAHPGLQLAGCRAGIDSHFEVSGTSYEGQRRPNGCHGVGLSYALEAGPIDEHFAARVAERFNVLLPDVRDEVAEGIHIDDLPGNPVLLCGRPRDVQSPYLAKLSAERVRGSPCCQMGGDRAENVPAVEGAAHLRKEEPLFSKLYRPFHAQYPGGEAEKAVVRAYEKIVPGLYEYRLSFPAHAGIDHANMNRASGKVPVCLKEDKSSLKDIAGTYEVGYVYDGHVWGGRQHGPLHRPGIGVLKAEIGCKGNYPVHFRVILYHGKRLAG